VESVGRNPDPSSVDPRGLNIFVGIFNLPLLAAGRRTSRSLARRGAAWI
jgi:hypothetical protein